MENKWELLTPLTTVKVGEKLWMTLIPHLWNTPVGIKTTPAGFFFDHASVPTLFTRVVKPVKSCLAEGSLPHDDMFGKDGEEVPFKFANEGLREITLETAKMTDNSHKFVAKAAYFAVSFAKGLYDKQYNAEKFVDAYKPFKELGIEETRKKFIISYEPLPNFTFK